MLSWFRRRRAKTPAPTITPRSETSAAVRVELAELTPPPEVFLGRLGYAQLVLFENLSRAVAAAPRTADKSSLSRAAAELLAGHQSVRELLEELGADPDEAMEPFQRDLDDFQRRTQGADWYEVLVTCYLTTGFLADFFAGLAGGLPDRYRDRALAAIQVSQGEELLVELLRAGIEGSPRLSSRLALWGRRLVGDTMLIARRALEIDGALPGEERTEPVFSELVGAHTRRMDALGLTA